jgi:hypothetical protein
MDSLTFPVLSSFCLFDLDDGFEEKALGLRFKPEAEAIINGDVS